MRFLDARAFVVAALCLLAGCSDRSVPDRDCADFRSWREAQSFYESEGGPGTDGHRLDADRDGTACEALR